MIKEVLPVTRDPDLTEGSPARAHPRAVTCSTYQQWIDATLAQVRAQRVGMLPPAPPRSPHPALQR
jgi:hypothetical protein